METSLKKWICTALNFMVLVLSHSICQMLAFFWELNSKRLYWISAKEKESRRLPFTSSTKREIRKVHVVIVQWQRENVQKSMMLVQSFFGNLNILLFCHSCWRRHHYCLSSLIFIENWSNESNVGFWRVHFDYEKMKPSELSFGKEDVFHIWDTMQDGVIGSWRAQVVTKAGNEAEVGIIPNKSRLIHYFGLCYV